MSTVLYSACYLDGDDLFHNNRLQRNIRYVNYYKSIQDELGFDNIIMVDNASSAKNLNKMPDGIDFIKFDNHLPRKGNLDYLYCWRTLYTLRDLVMSGGIDKVLMIDSDAYVLSKKLASHMKNSTSGWNTFWCPEFNFPESALAVLNADAFETLDRFCTGHYSYYNGQTMEEILPYTTVEKGFIGDRYGEKCLPQTKDMDFYCQTPLTTEIVFDKKD